MAIGTCPHAYLLVRASMILIDLPSEVIEEILIYCDPVDVAQAAKTCTTLRTLIYFSEDSKLWRELYLMQPFDDPRTTLSQNGRPRPAPIPWREELEQIIRMRTVITADDSLAAMKPGEAKGILRTLLQMICYVHPLKSLDDIGELSPNLVWTAATLRHGFLDRLEERGGWNPEERQLIARLHAYYGITRADISRESRVKSRAFVYNMAKYRPESEYGPLMPDGTVNWEHIQALHHVVSMHVVELGEVDDFGFALFPMSLPFTQIVVPLEPVEAEFNDWAGITGPWTVSFCFCDHRDLMLYNDGDPSNLDTDIFDNPHFREVFRSLAVTLSIRYTQPDPNHPDRPTIYFFGQMDDPSTSTMTGRVKMSADNQVQWHFVSGDQGNAIWSSEGIQVGGLRSSFGILGSWTTIFHDHDDPVGPFWLRKTIHRR